MSDDKQQPQNQAQDGTQQLVSPKNVKSPVQAAHVEDNSKQDQSSTSKNEFIEKPRLRTIAQRPEIPSNKEDLIKFLVDRLQQAEDAINDTQQLLAEERKKKQEIMRDLDQRTKQLNELLNEEKNTIQAKVQRELKSAIDQVMSERVSSEHQRDEFRRLNEEKDRELGDLRGELFQQKEVIRNLENQNQHLKQENNTFQARLVQLEKENHSLKKEKNEWDERLHRLQNEVEEHKGVIQKLSDVKTVLNKVIGEAGSAQSSGSSQAQKITPSQKSKGTDNAAEGVNKTEDQFWF